VLDLSLLRPGKDDITVEKYLQFQLHTFNCCPVCLGLAGVDPAKIRIVPEGLDTTLWDPARHKAINVSKLDLQQATGPLAPAAASLPGSKSGPMTQAQTANKPYSECHLILNIPGARVAPL
jgi:hypothetical protein